MRDPETKWFRKFVPALLGIALSAGSAQALQPPASVERILVPVAITDNPGALGSEWVSTLLVTNRGAVPVDIFPLYCAVDPCLFNPTVPPGKTIEAQINRFAPDAPGILLYVDSALSPSLTWFARLVDISRDSLSFGTEIPVVHERQFLTSTTRLAGIPVDPRFRNMLRIYEVDARSTASFTVRILSQEGVTLASRTLMTHTDSGLLELPTQPGGAQIGDVPASFGIQPDGDVTIEVTPNEPGTRFWTNVSVTNNNSQQVTMINPE
jgi:hypothetical protein